MYICGHWQTAISKLEVCTTLSLSRNWICIRRSHMRFTVGLKWHFVPKHLPHLGRTVPESARITVCFEKDEMHLRGVAPEDVD